MKNQLHDQAKEIINKYLLDEFMLADPQALVKLAQNISLALWQQQTSSEFAELNKDIKLQHSLLMAKLAFIGYHPETNLVESFSAPLIHLGHSSTLDEFLKFKSANKNRHLNTLNAFTSGYQDRGGSNEIGLDPQILEPRKISYFSDEKKFYEETSRDKFIWCALLNKENLIYFLARGKNYLRIHSKGPDRALWEIGLSVGGYKDGVSWHYQQGQGDADPSETVKETLSWSDFITQALKRMDSVKPAAEKL